MGRRWVARYLSFRGDYSRTPLQYIGHVLLLGLPLQGDTAEQNQLVLFSGARGAPSASFWLAGSRFILGFIVDNKH